MIKNPKTVDPQDETSTKVFQLETAMGSAIECFKGAGAVVVPRSRFAPVKKCNDLLLLRSDAYVVNEHYDIVLAKERWGERKTRMTCIIEALIASCRGAYTYGNAALAFWSAA